MTANQLQPVGKAENWDAVIIGAGAAGLMAGIRAAELGAKVLLLEKGKKAGVKILMSGGTRCNITHHCSNRDIVKAFGKNGECLHSVLAGFGVEDAVAFFEAEGVQTKVESTGKVFPVSNRASDVLNALLRRLHRAGAVLWNECPVMDLRSVIEGFELSTQMGTIYTEKVLLCSGGKSFPRCGTTGDGYEWVHNLGHTLLATHPSLVPLTTAVAWVKELSGITLKDTLVTAGIGSKVLGTDRGAWLFTHFGFSGPAPMNLSRLLTTANQMGWLKLDSLPDTKAPVVEEMILATLQPHGKKTIAGLLSQTFGEAIPLRWAEALVAQAAIYPLKKALEMTRSERQKIVAMLKGIELPVSGSSGFEKAEVTTGGVCVKEVNFKTMESKMVPGLFFAGEILDLDGPIGGYNFQAAWSTGWAAGTSLALGVKS